MSTTTTIDENIVSMKFNNKDFEKNAAATMTTLEKLKDKLDFSGIKDELSKLDLSKVKKAVDSVGNIDTSKITRVMDQLEYRMSTIGIMGARIAENIADKLFNVIDAAFSKLTSAYNFAKSGITQGGYSRATNIQAAKFQLEGLGIAWRDIYGDIDYAVTNTAYSLDAAAKVAAQLSASGLKPGQAYTPTGQKGNKDYVSQIDTLAMTLRAISGTASMANADYADIGRIITNMISRGRVFTTDINSLSERGLGVKGLLAEYLNSINYEGKSNWTEGDIAENISTKGGGTIKPDIVVEMLYEKFGEYATKANMTLSGVTANLRSAFARIGESFYEPIIENGGALVNLIDALRIHVNSLNSALKPVIKAIGGDIASWLDKLGRRLYTEVEMTDANGNVVTDPVTGEVMKKKVIRKDTIFAPLFEEKEYKRLEKITSNFYALPEYVKREMLANGAIIKDGAAYYEVIEKYSNAGRVLYNVWNSVKNIFGTIGDSILAIGRGFGWATQSMSFMDMLVAGTEKLRIATEKIRASVGQSRMVQFLLSVGKALGSIITISKAFFKSLYKHIITPLFGSVSKLFPGFNLIDSLTDFNQKLFMLSEKIKNSDDFFGPFMERFKNGASAFWEWVKSWGGKLTQALSNFFEPIKEIFSNSELSFLDKLKALKDYLVQDFVMPGWEKVKSLFEGIGDAIRNVFEWFKKLFGISDKEESGATTTGATGGNGFLGSAATINGLSILSISEQLKEAGGNVDEGSTGFLSAFEKLKDFFSGLDLSPAAIMLTIFTGALLALVGAILYTLIVLPVKLTQLADVLPKFIKALSAPFTSLSKTIKSVAFKNNAQGLRDLGIGLIAIVGAITIFALLIDKAKIDPVTLIQSIAYVALIFTLLSVGLVVMAKAMDSMNASLSISFKKGEGLNWVQRGGTFESLARTMMSILAMTVIFTGLAAALAWLSSDPVRLKFIYDGFIKLAQLLAFILVFTVIIPGIMAKIVSSGKHGLIGGSALLGIAKTMISMTIAVVSFTAIAMVLQALPEDALRLGLLRLAMVGTFIAGILFVINVVSSLFGGSTNGMGRTLLGIAAVIATMGAAMLSIIIALKLLMYGVNSENLDQYVTMMIGIGALIAVLGLMVALITAAASSNSLKKGSSLLGTAIMIASMTAMIVVISAAIMTLSSLLSSGTINASALATSTAIVIGSIVLLLGIVSAVLYFVQDVSAESVGKAAGLIASITVFVGVVTLCLAGLTFLSKFGDMTMALVSLGVMTLILGAMGALILKASSSLQPSSMGTVLATIISMTAGLLAITGALVWLVSTIQSTNTPWQTVVAIMGGLVLTIGVIAFSATKIMDHLKSLLDSKEIDFKKILSVAAMFVAIGAGIAIMVASLAFLQNMDVAQIAVGGAMLAVLTYITTKMAEFGLSLVNGRDSGFWKDIAQMMVIYAGVAITIRLLAGALAKLAGFDWTSIAAAGVALSIMSLVVAGLTHLLIKMSDGIKSISGLVASVAAYIGITFSMTILAGVLKKLTGFAWDDIKVGLISALACMTLLALILVILSKMPSTGVLSGSVGLLAIAGVMVGIGLSAFLLASAIDTLVEALDKLDKTGGDWNTKMTSFKDKIVGVLHAVIDAVAEVATDFAMLGFTLVTSALNYIGDNWDTLGQSVTHFLQGVAEALKKYAQPIIDAVFDILNASIEGITYAITSARGAILLENIKHLGITIGIKLYEGIKEALKDTKLGEFLFGLNNTAYYKTMREDVNASKDKVVAALDQVDYIDSKDFIRDLDLYNSAQKLYDEYVELESKNNRGMLVRDSDEYDRWNELQNMHIEYGGEELSVTEYFEQMDSVIDSYISSAADVYASIEEGMITQAKENERYEKAIRYYGQLLDTENYEKAKAKAEEEWKTRLPELQTEKQTLESDLAFMQKQLEEETGPAVVRSAKKAAVDYQQSLIDNINKEIEAGPQIKWEPLYADLNTTAETSATEAVNAASTATTNAVEEKTPQLRDDLVEPFKLDDKHYFTLLNYGAQYGDAFITGTRSKKGVDSNSPSKAMIRVMEDVGDGMLVGLQEIMPMAEDSGSGLGESIVGSMDSALGNIDFESTGTKIIDGLKGKLPAKEEFTGLFGLDKGIAGNIQGLKTAWGKIKGIFSGDFDISDIFSNLIPGDMGIENLTSAFGADFDIGSFGYSDSFMTDKAWEDALANFDPNTMMTTDTLNLNLNIDDAELQNLNKSMSKGVDWNAVTEGYNARGGTTYNYNYNYIQNNTSSGALNTRELNRSTQLALNRNKWRVGGGGY